MDEKEMIITEDTLKELTDGRGEDDDKVEFNK